MNASDVLKPVRYKTKLFYPNKVFKEEQSFQDIFRDKSNDSKENKVEYSEIIEKKNISISDFIFQWFVDFNFKYPLHYNLI